ncbi:uncharacterized protein HGUI_00615 [Hanseniaspora guilliermondii]|uniref:non-specific serine/threonine protein kinase n=1 Tax=Hanseniaspora guilliermondii TaxID=56406 RepID=A0A1L0CUI7_9ASCO|nr:uncharacterized protein HGUI_00615 [Hanseniaspora guilliermondii]
MESSDSVEYLPIGYTYNFIGNTSGVKILKHISNGGFAQVYQVSYGFENKIACLKRVIVKNKQALNILRAEVDCMRILKDNSAHIVTYIDSNASRFDSNGKYEVLVLMELCENGSLIDYMNTRLTNRFTEIEVLNIFDQTCRGIYAMHRLQPPLLHRDIKIENILINRDFHFKLCDFGSVCGIIRPPKNLEELNYAKNDLLSNTTAQYRPPEILQVAINNQINIRIDEKSDIWALGVYLYKLCYYTTPFEFNNSGNNGILTGLVKFPDFPKYSNNMQTLISWCLQVDPKKRPNICELLEQVCTFEKKPCTLENFYKKRAAISQLELQKKHQTQRELLEQEQLKKLQAFKEQQAKSMAELSKNSGRRTPESIPDKDTATPSLKNPKSLPSVTTSSVVDYNHKLFENKSGLLEDREENKSKETIDPFSDLVTLAKLEKHSYKSTLNFDTNTGENSSSVKTVSASSNSTKNNKNFRKSNTSPNFDGDKTSDSIEQRMKNLMISDVAIGKSATGYGKYTPVSEKAQSTDLASIPKPQPGSTPPARPPRNSKKKVEPPTKPNKPEAIRAPPIPKKPQALKAEKLIETDIEKFDKKYPNIV